MDTDYTQAQENLASTESANIPSLLMRKFMGRPVFMRPGSKFLPALNMLSAVARTVGREVHVFVSPAALPASNEASSATLLPADEPPDEFYEFTPEDYSRVMSYSKKDSSFKTRKMRDEEENARRARITKATIRVQFPDNFILEAVFQPSEPVSMLHELLQKVLLKSHVPFYLYTTPPKERLKDLQQDMYAAGLTPGALVHFSHELSEGQEELEGPYLRPEIAALKDLHFIESPLEPVVSGTDSAAVSQSPHTVSETRRDPKRPATGKPKWFKQR